MSFPHPCTNCGLCCIAIPCPAAKTFMGVKEGQCPALEWAEENPDESRCGLITRPEHYLPATTMAFIRENIPDMPEFMGAGQGCCMAARVIGPNGPQDFAALSPENKIAYTRIIRENPERMRPPAN